VRALAPSHKEIRGGVTLSSRVFFAPAPEEDKWSV